MLVAVNFHYVRESFDAPWPGIHGLTVSQFGEQLDVLGGLGTFVSQADILSALDGEQPLPDDAVCVTFDDGLREQFEHALPVLQRKGVPAVFYVNTEPINDLCVQTVHRIHLLRAYTEPGVLLQELTAAARRMRLDLERLEVPMDRAAEQYRYDTPDNARLKYLLNFVLQPRERDALIDSLFAKLWPEPEQEAARRLYMTMAQVRELGSLGYIGTHAHQHVPLGVLEPDEARLQVLRSVTLLEEWTGAAVASVSYPYGSRAACPAGMAALGPRLGLRFGFTMERAGNASMEAPFYLARLASNDAPPSDGSTHGSELFSSISDAQWFREAGA